MYGTGGWPAKNRPAATETSTGLSGVARTRTSASPALGSGSGRSAARGGRPISLTTRALTRRPLYRSDPPRRYSVELERTRRTGARRPRGGMPCSAPETSGRCDTESRECHVKVAIVGAGAMGCVFGAAIAESGPETVLIDVSPDVVEAISTAGVMVRRNGVERHVRLSATLDPATVGPVDVLIMFVKGFHTRSAAQAASGPRVGRDHRRHAPERPRKRRDPGRAVRGRAGSSSG